MSVHTADSQFSFRLPSLSYIDTSWEEQDPRATVASPSKSRKGGIAAWLSRQVTTLISSHRDNVAARELAEMSDHDLLDIGISRSDLPKLFDANFIEELRQRRDAR